MYIYNKYSFHNYLLHSCHYIILDMSSYFKDLIMFVSSYTSIVNSISLYQVPPAQIWLTHGYVNFSGHQPDEPAGFYGGLGQQLTCNVLVSQDFIIVLLYWLLKITFTSTATYTHKYMCIHRVHVSRTIAFLHNSQCNISPKLIIHIARINAHVSHWQANHIYLCLVSI